MSKAFRKELDDLEQRLMNMAQTAGKMVHAMTRALVDWDVSAVDPLPGDEEQLDLLECDLDDEVVKLITKYNPVASQLRVLMMISRITAELERIGDQVMNIRFYCRKIMRDKPLKPLVDIPKMGETAEAMVRKAMEAFRDRSVSKALEVMTMDNQVDELNDAVYNELMHIVSTDTTKSGAALELILTARAFERIADHAVSMAEDVVYVVEGMDVRHRDEVPGAGRRDSGSSRHERTRKLKAKLP